MSTPFDEVVREVRARGFHNHRTEGHSGTVSRGILRDLRAQCEPFRGDIDGGSIRQWLDFPSPGGRARKLDLVVAEPGGDAGEPDLSRLRLCVENKSVVTAHRNRTNRYDDLSDVVGVLHQKKPDAVLIATVLVGVAEHVLNVPDRVKPFVPPEDFADRILPRLSTGDETLWDEFPRAVSRNRPRDAERTVEKFRELPSRPPGRTDLAAYDYVLLVPVFIDNVHPPSVARDNALGIDVDAQYRAMLDRICKAYTARWHW
ncbi:MAG: hypothetical protein HYY96_10845 [Candidatus Tectomicrobia bacterium]|nr:hypothetical protein [Candidatus Tectomicrobia bacterium]